MSPDYAGVGGFAGDTVENSDEELESCEEEKPTIVDCAAPEECEEKPGEDAAKHANGEEADTHIEGFVGGEASLYLWGQSAWTSSLENG